MTFFVQVKYVDDGGNKVEGTQAYSKKEMVQEHKDILPVHAELCVDY